MAANIESLSARLRQLRLAAGLRQAELSRLTGVPQAQISRIEANAVDMRVSTLRHLAHGLGSELVLVPHRSLPAVHAVMRQTMGSINTPARPAYTLEDDDD